MGIRWQGFEGWGDLPLWFGPTPPPLLWGGKKYVSFQEAAWSKKQRKCTNFCSRILNNTRKTALYGFGGLSLPTVEKFWLFSMKFQYKFQYLLIPHLNIFTSRRYLPSFFTAGRHLSRFFTGLGGHPSRPPCVKVWKCIIFSNVKK